MAFEYFTGLSDIDLAKDVIAKNPDLFISRYEFIGSGVLDLTVPTVATLTPSPASAFTVNEFVSTQYRNLFVVDDTLKVSRGIVDANIATAAVLMRQDTGGVDEGRFRSGVRQATREHRYALHR